MKPLKWGVLSTAGIARGAYMPAFAQSEHNTVVAVASRQREKAQAFADEFNVERAYGSYESLLSDPDIDAVYIPLPIHMHCEWTIKAAQVGKAVLVEKPMALNAEEAAMMVSICQKHDVLFAEALPYRYHPLTETVLSIIERGDLGDLRILRSVFFSATPPGENIRLKRETGGGAMLDVGSYCVSLLRVMAGAEPERVEAQALIHDVDETVAATFMFPGGVMGELGCGLKMCFDCSYEVIGQEGRLRVPRGAMVPWPGEAFTIELTKGHDTEIITVPEANHHVLLIDDFADAYHNQRSTRFALADSVNNLATIDRVFASAGIEPYPACAAV